MQCYWGGAVGGGRVWWQQAEILSSASQRAVVEWQSPVERLSAVGKAYLLAVLPSLALSPSQQKRSAAVSAPHWRWHCHFLPVEGRRSVQARWDLRAGNSAGGLRLRHTPTLKQSTCSGRRNSLSRGFGEGHDGYGGGQRCQLRLTRPAQSVCFALDLRKGVRAVLCPSNSL